MPRRESLLVGEMITAAERAIELAEGCGVAELEADVTTRDALLWNFAVLGEAASQLPVEFRASHPEVNWSRPVQLRNRIIHGYWSVDLDILLTTAERDLPQYVAQLDVIRTLLGSGPQP